MSLKEHLEHLVSMNVISAISMRIDGNKEACLYQDNNTLDFMVWCCDHITYGHGRVCRRCHVYAPVIKEVEEMAKRKKYYQTIYPEEDALVEIKKDLHRYVRRRCDGVLLYSTFLDYVREWDARYSKYDVMDFRDHLVRTLRKSVYLAVEEMGWSKAFTLFEREEFDKLSEEEKKDKLSADGGGVNGIIMKMVKK